MRKLALVLTVAVAMVAVLALAAFMTTVSSNGGTTSVSATGPTPTTEPNPGTDGILSGVYDLEVSDGVIVGYSCILRSDHDADTNRIKTAAVCAADVEVGDPANALFGVNVPGEGPDGLSGPPPPPPYTIQQPYIGAGEYYPGGNADCGNVGSGTCSVTITCFPEQGAGSLGPNTLAKFILPDPDATPDAQTGTVEVVIDVSIKQCDSLDPTVFPVGPISVGLFAPGTASETAWRTAAFSATDFDGDGCSDFDELDTKGTRPKGCGDDPYNPTDSNQTDYSGAYNILVTIIRSDFDVPGSYFGCLADFQQTGNGKTDGDLVARAFCYTDGFQVVNALGYPGVTGDGYPGGGPPWGAIPICVGTGIPSPGNCVTNPTPAQLVGAGETDCGRFFFGVDLDEDGDTVPNDGCPSEGFGDVDSKHTELKGYIDNADNTLKFRGCFEDTDGSDSLGNVYIEWVQNKNTGVGSADFWVDQPAQDCTGSYAWGTYSAIAGLPIGDLDDAGIFIVRQPGGATRDTDQDGIPDATELVDAQDLNGCGGRDPFNPWDNYDVNKDGVIDLANDILGVIQHRSPNGSPPYDVIYDRGPTMTGAVGHWNRGAPDGVIDLPNDILGVILQYHPGVCGPGGKAPSPPGSPTNAAMSISVDGAQTMSCPATKVNGETCVGFNNSFDVIVSADTIPVDGYLLAQAWVDFDNQGLTWSANSTTWPDCGDITDFGGLKGNAAMQGCLTGLMNPPPSIYTGELFRITLTCSSTASESVLKLIPSGTAPANTNGSLFTNAFGLQEIPAVGGDLLVNCVTEGTPTPPPPTPTPTPNPGSVAVDAIGDNPSPGDPVDSKRTAQVGVPFLITTHVPKIAGKGSGGFSAYTVEVTWDEAVLDYNPRLLSTENVWPEPCTASRSTVPDDGSGKQARVSVSCVSNPTVLSTYTGPVVQLEFVCEQVGTSQLSLVSMIADPTNGTRLIDANGGQNGPPLVNASVNCVAPDKDSDGIPDWFENSYVCLNPNDGTDAATDGDSDGQSALSEYAALTDPCDPDTDGDGLNDGLELKTHGTDPLSADTDGDGLDDFEEINTYSTSPTVADSDNDGLNDGFEVSIGTNPNNADSDNDTFGDGLETTLGSDPTIQASTPESTTPLATHAQTRSTTTAMVLRTGMTARAQASRRRRSTSPPASRRRQTARYRAFAGGRSRSTTRPAQPPATSPSKSPARSRQRSARTP